MVVGKFPFESPNIISLFTNIARGKFIIPEWVGPELTDLIKGILQVDPDNRLTLAQIKKHCWMKIAIKDNTSNVPIEPISSLFGQDNKSFHKITEDFLRTSNEPLHSSGNKTTYEDYTDTNSENSQLSETDPVSSNSINSEKSDPEPDPQKKRNWFI